MKKLTLTLALFLFVAIGWTQNNQTDQNQQSSQEVQSDEYVCISRDALKQYSPGLLKDLEDKYGNSLSVNPTVKHRTETFTKVLGMKIALTRSIDKTLAIVTTETEKFAHTGLGVFTMVLIAWNIVGDNIGVYVIYFPIYILFLIFFFVMWRKKGIVCKEKESETLADDGVTKIVKYKVIPPNAGFQMLLFCIFVIVTWIMLGIL